MKPSDNPIGVLDSGVGGISTLRMLTKDLPREHFIYYGDLLNAPYGTKTTAEVIDCVHRVTEQLMARQIKALVIACNTATGAALTTLRQELPIPVIGVKPSLRIASKLHEDGNVLALATPLTLRQESFRLLMEEYPANVIPVPCGGLMDLVEAEDWAGAETYLRELFSGYDMSRTESVVLGCTHYMFLRNIITRILPRHLVVSNGFEALTNLKGELTAAGLLRESGEGSVEFLCSDGKPSSIEKMNRFYSMPLPD